MPRKKRKGNIRFQGFGSRSTRAEVTTHPIRLRQFPKLSRTARKNRFTIPKSRFSYLPHSPRHLGPATPLGDDIVVIMEFNPSPQLRQSIDSYLGNDPKTVKGKRRKTLNNVQKIRADLRPVARAYFQRIRDEMRRKIREVVPKMTGRLRNGMIATLTKCINSLKNMPFILKLNTLDAFGNPIYYANPVNNMPTAWLAHPPNQPLTRVKNGKTYQLFDPMAETDWYNKVLKHGRDFAYRTRKTLRLEVIRLYGISPLTEQIYLELMRSIKFK